MSSATIHHGDMLEILRSLPDNSIDACITDGPYHLEEVGKRYGKPTSAAPKGGPMQRLARGFMRQTWDGGDITFRSETWAEVHRVLKPGGHLSNFSAARYYHLMACAVDQGGFEIRDMVNWIYATGQAGNCRVKGEGIPENTSCRLKPAHEPFVIARKPLEAPSIRQNIREWGTGGLNFDNEHQTNGRLPTNVVFSHHPGCQPQCVEGCPVLELVAQGGREEFFQAFDWLPQDLHPFHYIPKPATWEKEAGTDGLESKLVHRLNPGGLAEKEPKRWGPRMRRNTHGTVKPIRLMQWAVETLCPPGGTVLDPFLGSGTTGIASVLQGREFIGIEREPSKEGAPDYVGIARSRIRHAERMPWVYHPNFLKWFKKQIPDRAELPREAPEDEDQLPGQLQLPEIGTAPNGR